MRWRAAGSSAILLCICINVCSSQGRGSRRFGASNVDNVGAGEQLSSASTTHKFSLSDADRRSSRTRTSQNIVERDVEVIPPSGFAKLASQDVPRTRESLRESSRDRPEGSVTVSSKREFQSRNSRPIESSGVKEYERLTSVGRGSRTGGAASSRTRPIDSTPTAPVSVTNSVRSRPVFRPRAEFQQDGKETEAADPTRSRSGASSFRSRGGVSHEVKTVEPRGRLRESSSESLKSGGKTVEAVTAASPTSSRTGRQRTFQEVPSRGQFRSRGNQGSTETPTQTRGPPSRGSNRFPSRTAESPRPSESPTRSNFRSRVKLAPRNEILSRNTVAPIKADNFKTEPTTSLPTVGGNVVNPPPTETVDDSLDSTSPDQRINDIAKPDGVSVEPLTPGPELNEFKPQNDSPPPSTSSRGLPGSRRRGSARGPKLEEGKMSKSDDMVSEDENYPEFYKQLKKSGSGPKEILALLKAKKQLRESQQLSKIRPFPVTSTTLASSSQHEVTETSPRSPSKYSGRNFRKSPAADRVVASSTEEPPNSADIKSDRNSRRGQASYRTLEGLRERNRPSGDSRLNAGKSVESIRSEGDGRRSLRPKSRWENTDNEVLVRPSPEASTTKSSSEDESNELVNRRPSLEDSLQLTAPGGKNKSKYVPRNREKDAEKFRARTTESVNLSASESTPIRPRYELFNRNRESGYKRSNFVTPLPSEISPTSEKSNVVDRFKSRPSFKPSRKYNGKTYSSRYSARQKERELLLTENTSTQNNKFEESEERANFRRFNGLSVDSLVSESEQIQISTEPNVPGKKRSKYKESYIQRVPPKRKPGEATTARPFIFPTTDLWEALSQTKDLSSTESSVDVLAKTTTEEGPSTEDDFLKGDLVWTTESETMPVTAPMTSTTVTTTTPSTTTSTTKRPTTKPTQKPKPKTTNRTTPKPKPNKQTTAKPKSTSTTTTTTTTTTKPKSTTTTSTTTTTTTKPESTTTTTTTEAPITTMRTTEPTTTTAAPSSTTTTTTPTPKPTTTTSTPKPSPKPKTTTTPKSKPKSTAQTTARTPKPTSTQKPTPKPVKARTNPPVAVTYAKSPSKTSTTTTSTTLPPPSLSTTTTEPKVVTILSTLALLANNFTSKATTPLYSNTADFRALTSSTTISSLPSFSPTPTPPAPLSSSPISENASSVLFVNVTLENAPPLHFFQNTSNPSPSFVVYGLLPNNNLVRKVVKTTKAPAIDLPFIIYGLYPNGTIVRRFPNGTILPEEEEQENEIIANIDPGNRAVLEEVVKKDNPLAYLYPPNPQSTTGRASTTVATVATPSTTTTREIVNMTTEKSLPPVPSTTTTTKKPSTSTQSPKPKVTTTKLKATPATTKQTTTKPSTTTPKPTTTRKPVPSTTVTTTTSTTSTTTTKKPTASTTTRRPTTSSTTVKLTSPMTPRTTATVKATPSTSTTPHLETKSTKAKSTTRSINDITTPRTASKAVKPMTTSKPKPSTLSDIELLNNVINGASVTPRVASTEAEAELANKVIQLAIERATQKSKTSQATVKPKNKPRGKPKSSATKATTTSTTSTTTTTTTTSTSTTTTQSTPDMTSVVTPTPTMTIFKFSEENKTLVNEELASNNKTGKISLWVLPADDNSTLATVNGDPQKGTNEDQALQALLAQPELANLSANEQLLLADVLSSTAFPQTTQKKRKKKPKTTPTTTTPAPLFPVLNALFGRNRGGGLFGGGGLFRNQIGAGRGLFGGRLPESSTVRTAAAFGDDDFDETDPPPVEVPPETQRGLVGAAINVTRAVSQFMGYVIQGATQSFQNYLQTRSRALAETLTYPGSA